MIPFSAEERRLVAAIRHATRPIRGRKRRTRFRSIEVDLPEGQLRPQSAARASGQSRWSSRRRAASRGSFANGFEAVKEFIETDGELPTCIKWGPGIQIPQEAFFNSQSRP
jgi:hypothetical protein